jgi:hypothetical protein
VIYTHAAEKFHRRIDKRWEEFLAFTKALKVVMNDASVPQAEPSMNYLNLVRVSEFLEFLHDRPADKDFFVRIADGFIAAASALTNAQLEEWSTLVYWHHPGGESCLFGYISNLVDSMLRPRKSAVSSAEVPGEDQEST